MMGPRWLTRPLPIDRAAAGERIAQVLRATVVWCALASSGAGAAVESAAALYLDADGRPVVVEFSGGRLPAPPGARGWVVWEQGDQERSTFFQRPEDWSPEIQATKAGARPRALSLTRSLRGTDGGATAGSVLLTQRFEQLSGVKVLRGKHLVTPAPGKGLLRGHFVIRRRAATEGPVKYPVETIEVKQGVRVLARLTFADGNDRIATDQVPALAQGLPAGEYALAGSAAADPAEVLFVVEDEQRRAAVLGPADRMATLLGSPLDPLAVQVRVERLLAARDEKGSPYLTDALDAIESVPKPTAHLAAVRSSILACLTRDGGPPATAAQGTPTGIPDIDEARGLIAAGRWQEATTLLGNAGRTVAQRERALATLYQAVIQAESGLADEAAADALYRHAAAAVDRAGPGMTATDRFRVHYEYAGFLIDRARDRLHSSASRIRTGARRTVLDTVHRWLQAARELDQSARSASSPAQAADVAVARAQLFALLADLIRLVDVPAAPGQPRPFEEGERAAAALARAAAGAALAEPSADAMVRAVAAETRAQIAFRSGDFDTCIADAEVARDFYLQSGALAGVESIERLLGLTSAKAEGNGPAARRAALRHLLVSETLAEHLRENVPEGRIGLARAGFLSRRAYVYAKVVELEIAEGNAAEALRHAEAAKARGFEDVVAAVGARGASPDPSHNVAGTLAHWPKDVAALEYFLGEARGWVFLVSTAGKVRVFELAALLDGRPFDRDDLTEQTHALLEGMKHTATQMQQQLERTRSFDHGWQVELHRFCRTLMPPGVLEELRAMRPKLVVVVPHHILHCFPFAGLVTRLDTAKRGPTEMVKPGFLIQEPFVLVNAPSLVSWDALRRQPLRRLERAGVLGVPAFPGAPPLPGVEDDIKNFQAAFGRRLQTVIKGEKATESQALALLAQPGLAFFATHGHNVPDAPLESFLLCYPDDARDGHLTAAEIYKAPVRADLVVLGACYSGLADRSPLEGDDLFGIQRALLRSGAKAVVSSAWDVYDLSSPKLIDGMFRRVAAGTGVAAAMAESQRAFLAESLASSKPDPFIHPYFWAVYNVTGDDRVH